MLKHLKLLVAGAALAVALPAMAEAKTFYWISHGGPADPVWTYFLQGANQWAEDTGNTVNTSFHSGDVPSQQEAVRSAIAAGADAIVTTSPDPGSMNEVVNEAHAAGIPVININTPDPTVDFDAYVGMDLVVGRRCNAHWRAPVARPGGRAPPIGGTMTTPAPGRARRAGIAPAAVGAAPGLRFLGGGKPLLLA